MKLLAFVGVLHHGPLLVFFTNKPAQSEDLHTLQTMIVVQDVVLLQYSVRVREKGVRFAGPNVCALVGEEHQQGLHSTFPS